MEPLQCDNVTLLMLEKLGINAGHTLCEPAATHSAMQSASDCGWIFCGDIGFCHSELWTSTRRQRACSGSSIHGRIQPCMQLLLYSWARVSSLKGVEDGDSTCFEPNMQPSAGALRALIRLSGMKSPECDCSRLVLAVPCSRHGVA